VVTVPRPPRWIKPQLTRFVEEAPPGDGWVHEIKYDGYRMHARIDGKDVKLLTRNGLDWSHRYRRTIEALGNLKVKSASRQRAVRIERRRGPVSIRSSPAFQTDPLSRRNCISNSSRKESTAIRINRAFSIAIFARNAAIASLI
jgi:hypothetical protein